jgi:HAD superfamily hydrolase (TIGR01509 family)
MRRIFAAVLLDLDGTLVDSEPLHCEAHKRFLATQGIIISEAEILGNIGKSDRKFYCDLMERFSRPGDVEAWMAEKTRTLIGIYREERKLSLMPGVEAFLDHARDEGVPCAVVTSSHRELAVAALEVTGLAPRLPMRICHEDTPKRKPDPSPYLLAASRLGVAAAHCLVIEDSVFGVTAGVAAGAYTVALRGYTDEAEVRAAGARRVISSLDELIPLAAQLTTAAREPQPLPGIQQMMRNQA